MHVRDISQDKHMTYRLKENEKGVFFMLNRRGEITFNLSASGAEAHILSVFIGKSDEHTLSVIQRHTAPKTTSRFIAKNLVSGSSRFTYDGLIVIGKRATLSDASQECRNLLLSEGASAIARPTLEIKTDDVKVHHAATTSTLAKEALFFVQSRGLDERASKQLLVTGFAESVFDEMPALFIDEKEKIRKVIRQHIENLLAP